MRLDDLMRVSVRQVLRQRWRNLGVVLAIALGTAGFIVIMTMGRDVRKNLNQDLELLGGATRIKTYFENPRGKYRVTRQEWFREYTLPAIRRLPGVEEVSLLAPKSKSTLSARGDTQYFFKLVGVDEYFWKVHSLSPLAGRFFGPKEVKGRKRVCVLGQALAKKIFGHTKVVGLTLPLDNDLYEVVGVLRPVGLSSWSHWTFIPLTTAQDRVDNIQLPTFLYIRCRTWDDVEGVAAQLPEVVKAHQPAEGLRVEVAWDALKRVKGMAWGIELFVNLAVCATLVLGGFGIWNITMSGVRARTREIGLKKAMGAEDRDILAQFLAEALFLSLGAAVVGVALGRAGVELLASLLGSHPSEELFLLCVVLSLIFAVVLGIGAGLPPSIRASRMEVVSAVRYE